MHKIPKPFSIGGVQGCTSGDREAVFQRDIGLVSKEIEMKALTFTLWLFEDDVKKTELLHDIKEHWVFQYKNIISVKHSLSDDLYKMFTFIDSNKEAQQVEYCLLRAFFAFYRAYFDSCTHNLIGLPEDEKLLVKESGAILSYLPPDLRKKIILKLRDTNLLQENVPIEKYTADFKDSFNKFQQEVRDAENRYKKAKESQIHNTGDN